MAGAAQAATVVASRTTGRHGAGQTIGGLQGPVAFVTSGAGVMDLDISRIDWSAAGSAGGGGMAADTIRVSLNQ